MEDPEAERRRAAAERMRGMFADPKPDRSLVDELIAERRTEARLEDREDRKRLGNGRRRRRKQRG